MVRMKVDGVEVEVEEVEMFKEYIIRIGNVATVYVPRGVNLERFFALLKRLRVWSLGDLVDMITSRGERLVPFSSYGLKLGGWRLILNVVDSEGADVVLEQEDGSYLRIIAKPSVIVPAVLNLLRKVLQEVGGWS
jgi:hypothetical protein